MDQFKRLASAVVADSLYGTVTLDLDTILSWGTQPFTDFYNNIVKLSNTFFDTEWKETGSWYDGKFMRKFLTAMQQPMEEQSDSIAELSDNLAGSILPIISVYADDVKEHLVNSPEQLAELINNWTWDGNISMFSRILSRNLRKRMRVIKSFPILSQMVQRRWAP